MTNTHKDIKLSIAIPTFNGSRTIRTMLDSILSQLEPGVEVVISDNASTDNTLEIIREYQNRYAQVSCFSNRENLKFDRNVDIAVRKSRGNFVWLFADDDLMHENAISHVLCVIEKYPDVAEIFADSYKQYTNLQDDYLCPTGEEFFEITKFRCGGLSSNIVNKSIWENTNLSEYIGLDWIHMGFLVSALSKHPSLICKDCFKSEIKNTAKRWGENGAFFMSGLKIVKVFLTMRQYGYSKRIMRKAILMIKNSYWRAIPSAKAKGLKVDKNLVGECFRLYKGFPTFWFIDLPLLFIPNIIFRFLWELYAFGKSIVSRTHARSDKYLKTSNV